MRDPGDMAERRARLSPAKQALLERRLHGKREVETLSPSIPRLSDRTAAPLSFAQQRLWFAHHWDPQVAAYNRPTALRLKGELHVPSLEQSLSEIVRRHDVLHAAFPVVDGQPVQCVGAMGDLSLPVDDLSYLEQGERLTAARQRMADMLARPFALESGPLFRVRLFRLDVADHILLFVSHHILFDGWSEALFVNELCALYQSFRSNEPSTLPDLPIQYGDFAAWQRDQVGGEALKVQIAYWRKELWGALPVLDLPADRPRASMQTFRGATQSLVLSGPLVAELETVSRQEGVTLFMTLLAAFTVMLYRYTGQPDIIVGTPVSGRRQPETQKLIGVFVNMLALRTDLGGNPAFRELLRRVRHTCLGAYSHQDVPFDMLVAELNPERDLARTPVFQVVFNLENLPGSAVSAADIQVIPLDLETHVALFDLSVELAQRDGEIHCVFGYNTGLFDAATIERMAGHYETLLEGVAADPGRRLSDLPLLTRAERHQLLVEWNETRAEYPGDMTVHQLFEAQVERTPDAVAVTYESRALTYRELNSTANRLAHYLRNQGVGPETPVGVCLERSLETVVALLGILKAGGTYLPLDAADPLERLAFMLQDTGAGVVVTEARLGQTVRGVGARLVCLDTDRDAIARESVMNPPNRLMADSLIYVMYSSGTSGRPKAIGVTHRGVVSFVKQGGCVQLDGEVFLHLSPLTFDASTLEIWLPLVNGARLAVMEAGRPSLEQVGRSIKEGGVTTLWLTAGLFHMMVEERLSDLGRLHQLMSGGDVVSMPHVARVVKELPAVRMFDTYGPTETTAYSIYYPVPADMPGSIVPIGRPIANTQAYVLDENLQPVPVGVPGELYIGGAGLARGYLNNPGLTAEKFVPNPYDTEGGARLYRTGDLARFLRDGNLEFLGRADRQVKIRGFRIEPAEIEGVLEQYPGVRRAAVVPRDDLPGGRGLVGYLVADREPRPTIKALRSYVRDRLPDYMTPAAFMFLDALPLTPNGKVDRAKLPAPERRRPELAEAFAAPATPVELGLAAIWARVLGLEEVGLHDDFFELGGHSLLATQVVSRIRDAFCIDLPLRRIFERPTIAGLATFIEQILSAVGKSGAPDATIDEKRKELVL